MLPTRDQHRREIASNLWVRLITGECSSFDSPLFLRPQLHQTSFQRRGESRRLSCTATVLALPDFLALFLCHPDSFLSSLSLLPPGPSVLRQPPCLCA